MGGDLSNRSPNIFSLIGKTIEGFKTFTLAVLGFFKINDISPKISISEISDTFLPLDLELTTELDNLSKTKIKMFQRIFGVVGIIFYLLLIKLFQLPLITFLLLWTSVVLIMSTYDLNIYIYKFRKYGLGEVLAEITKARRSIGLPF